MPEPEPKSSITQRAVDELCRELRRGVYTSGQALPSEHQLGERFGVSRMTVRVILARLERAGLIYRQQGRGTFACPAADGPAKAVALWLRELGKAGSPYMSELITGADSFLAGSGAHVSVISAPLANWSTGFRQALAGVMVIPFQVEPGDLRQLAALGLPYVTIMESDLPGPVVGMDPCGAARALVQGLLERGHRRFAMISGHRRHSDRQKRLGIVEALTAAGLPLEEVPDFETDYDLDAARTAAETLLRKRHRPTAVICFDDALALQVMSVAQRLGVRIPDDLSVTGFNDSAFSALVTPSLTTVRFPVREAGQRAAQQVIEAAQGRPLADVFLGHELVWRGSTGPVRNAETDRTA